MKKYTCDLCGEEIEDTPYKLVISVYHFSAAAGTYYVEKHLHKTCKDVVINGWDIEKSWQEFQRRHEENS